MTAFPLVVAAAVSFSPLALPELAAEGKERYDMWAKEKVRYLADRVRKDPHNAQLRVLLGNALYEDGHHYEAESHLQKALELQPRYAEAHCNLAVILHAESRLGEAERHYQAALEVDTSLVEAKAGLGALWCRTKRHNEGIALLEWVIGSDPNRINARYNLAVAYHKIGDYAMAIEHLGVVLEQNPTYPGGRRGLAQARFSRGLILLTAKKTEGALAQFDAAVKLAPDDADIYYAQGIAHMRLDQLEPAERAFTTAVGLEEDHVPALHNLGTVMEKAGRKTEAEYYFIQVQALTPHLHTIEAAREATYNEEYLMR